MTDCPECSDGRASTGQVGMTRDGQPLVCPSCGGTGTRTVVAPELSAGRELDALVEEKVLGLVWDERRCRVCGWPLEGSAIYRASDGHCWPDNCSMRPLPKERADAPRPYSTDIAAAWKVVEHCVGMFADFQRQVGVNRIDVRGTIHWRATLRSFTGAEAETAPLAICLAALKAVGA